MTEDGSEIQVKLFETIQNLITLSQKKNQQVGREIEVQEKTKAFRRIGKLKPTQLSL